jgi:MAF protein
MALVVYTHPLTTEVITTHMFMFTHFIRPNYTVLESKNANIISLYFARRKELLSLTGWKLSSGNREIDERPSQTESSREYVVRLAQEKARVGAAFGITGDLVIAADTAVVDQANGAELILGKPQDDLEAHSMLQWLRGRVHKVYTGIAVFRIGDNSLVSDVCCTAVPMREYSDREIHDYIATGDPLDKAGGYAIQHHGIHL